MDGNYQRGGVGAVEVTELNIDCGVLEAGGFEKD